MMSDDADDVDADGADDNVGDSDGVFFSLARRTELRPVPAPGCSAALGGLPRLLCTAMRAAARTPTVARRRGPLLDEAAFFRLAARVAAGL